jgi:membrane fusion protein, multidrug efflux system
MKYLLLLGAVMCVPAVGLSTAALAQGMPPGGMSGMAAPATQVGYIVMEPQSVPMTTTLPGRVVAYSTAEVRPQVGGIITSVSVKEGQTVAEGDVLFTIDDQNYRAEVEAAEASVSSAEAQLPSAESKVSRYQSLIDTGGVSQADLDTAKVELAQAKASVASARAQLRSAEITLAQTSIKAPIAGVVGSVATEIGSLVTAGQADAMTTIRKTDPIYVTLVESSSNMLSNRPDDANGPAEDMPSPKVSLTLDDGSVYDQTGTISSADLVVSESTGTVTLRATIPNPKFVLLPGMFVRAHVEIGEQDGVFLVPQRAVTFSSNGEPAAFFVTEDNKVEKRVITATQDMNNSWVVTAGVTAGDKLVVDGFQKISDGTSVSPIEVTISEDGVVYQDMSASAMPAGGPPADGSAPAGGDAATGTPPEGMTAPADAEAPAAESAQ